MVPPPPSQAGRFKPRKPAKKVVAPIEVSSGSFSVPSGGNENVHRGGWGPRGGGRDSSGRNRDGGRGGRGGRGRDGRGRFALPQGQVFFTAAPTGRGSSELPGVSSSLSASQRRNASGVVSSSGVTSGVGARAARLKREAADACSSEEIVGMLEEGVGSSVVKSALLSSGSDFQKANATTAFERALLGGEDQSGANFVPSGGDLYDSDTSDEGPRTRSDKDSARFMPPVCLPFPIRNMPYGIGSFPKEKLDKLAFDEHPNGGTKDSLHRAKYASPFVHPDDNDGIQFEKQNFFLVQLPTRLPPLSNAEMAEDGERNNESVNDQTSTVATPSLLTGAFDNSLSSAVPGKIGKIKIYKSGRTVLVVEGPTGTPMVEMNVSEGLTCGFRQHAVSIDLDAGTFVPIGNVGKSFVVTPNLSSVEI